MLIHLPNQEIDVLYRIRTEMEKIMNNFLFTFNRSVKASVLISSEGESMNILNFRTIIRYYTEKNSEEREKVYSMRVYKFFRGKYDEIYFEVGKPTLDTYFLIVTLAKMDIKFEVFEGNIDETTWQINNFEESGENITIKERISIDGISGLTVGMIEKYIVENKLIPLQFMISRGSDIMFFIVSINFHVDDPLETIDLTFFTKLNNSRLYIYRDDHNVADSIKQMKERVIRWRSNVIKFENIVDLLS